MSEDMNAPAKAWNENGMVGKTGHIEGMTKGQKFKGKT